MINFSTDFSLFRPPFGGAPSPQGEGFFFVRPYLPLPAYLPLPPPPEAPSPQGEGFGCGWFEFVQPITFPFGEGGTALAVTEEEIRRKDVLPLPPPLLGGAPSPQGEGFGCGGRWQVVRREVRGKGKAVIPAAAPKGRWHAGGPPGWARPWPRRSPQWTKAH